MTHACVRAALLLLTFLWRGLRRRPMTQQGRSCATYQPSLVPDETPVVRDRRVAALAFIYAAVYGAGVFAVTFAFNVPLNESLASADPSGDAAAGTWRAYEQSWTAWNHVRAVALSLAFAALAGAVVLHFSRGPITTASSLDGKLR
jgi:Domain of unknown function (DUF1772)